MINKNNGDFTIQTGYLRDHVCKLTQEKKIAAHLYEHVVVMKNLSDPADSYKYYSILRDVEKLIAYFQKMSDALSYIEQEATSVSRYIGQVIDENTDRVNYIVSDTFYDVDPKL